MKKGGIGKGGREEKGGEREGNRKSGREVGKEGKKVSEQEGREAVKARRDEEKEEKHQMKEGKKRKRELEAGNLKSQRAPRLTHGLTFPVLSIFSSCQPDPLPHHLCKLQVIMNVLLCRLHCMRTGRGC